MLRYLVICGFLLVLSACYVPQPLVKKYDPAMVLVDVGYMVKPTSFDSTKAAFYVSGGFMRGYQTSVPTNTPDDVMDLGLLSFNRGHLHKNINYAYGADLFAGSFRNKSLESSDPNYFRTKSVSGFKLKSSINYFKTIRNYDFRIIGFDLAYSQEFGDYTEFRKIVSKTENRYAIPANNLFSVGLSSEIIFKTRKGFIKQYGFGLNLRNTFNSLYYEGLDENGQKGGRKSGLTGSWSVYVQTKNIYFVGETSKAGGTMNLGYRF